MEIIDSNVSANTDDPSTSGWLFITFWATYFSMVFGIVYALI